MGRRQISADDVRLEVAGTIAERFESQVVALVLNSISLPIPIAEGLDGGVPETALLEKARAVGDLAEERIVQRLKLLDRPGGYWRFDVLADDIANIAVREARTADTFVALRPNGAMDPERLVEAILFGSGRHLFLVPGGRTTENRFRSHHPCLEWKPRVGASHGRRHAISTEGKRSYDHRDNRQADQRRECVGGHRCYEHLKHHGIDATSTASKAATTIAGPL